MKETNRAKALLEILMKEISVLLDKEAPPDGAPKDSPS